jgi:hypothetical protein
MTVRGLTLNRACKWTQRKDTHGVAQCPTSSFMSRLVLVQFGRRAVAAALCVIF